MPVTARLPHRLGIILPSRDRRGRRLPEKTRRLMREEPGVVQLAEWVASEGDQEAVAILVDSGMELVVVKETP